MSLNLLPSQAKFQVEIIKAKSLSRKVLTIFLIIWVILVSVILVLKQKDWWLKKEKIKYEVALSGYLQLSSEIITSQSIKFRAKLLGKVLRERFEYAQAFNMVENIFDSKIEIRDFELKEKKYFVMSVIASSDDAMKQVETRVAEVNMGTEPEVKNIVVKSAVYTKNTAQWLVTMEVYLK